MRKENKKMLAVVLFAVCVLTAAGMDGSISVASTETRQTDSIEKTQTISSALASALEQIPEVAAVAVSTQEWHQKAVSNVDGETDVLLAGEEGSEVVGKLYHNTIVDVEEKGVVWTRVSADEVNGYVKSKKSRGSKKESRGRGGSSAGAAAGTRSTGFPASSDSCHQRGAGIACSVDLL